VSKKATPNWFDAMYTSKCLGILVLLALSAATSLAIPEVEAQTSSVKILDSDSFIDQNGNLHVFGEMQNTGEANVESVNITGAFYDAEENLIEMNSSLADIDLLTVGQKSPFEIVLSRKEQIDKVHRYDLNATFNEAVTRIPYQDFQFVSRNLLRAPDRLDITGEIRNVGRTTAITLKVVATFYDFQGRIVGRATNFTRLLGPISYSYTVILPYNVGKVNDYTLQIQSDSYSTIPAHEGWSSSVDLWIISKAFACLPHDVQHAWIFYPVELHKGVTAPNNAVGNDYDHFYHPHDGYGGGPKAVARWYQHLVNNLTIGNRHGAVYSAGVMAHFMADMANPFNTAQSLEEMTMRDSYEQYVKSEMHYIQVNIGYLDEIRNVTAYAIEIASFSHEYYWSLMGSFTPGRWSGDTYKVTSLFLNLAVKAVASLWNAAIRESSLAIPEFPEQTAIFIAMSLVFSVAILKVRRKTGSIKSS